MNAEQLAAAGRLQAWIRDFGHDKPRDFIVDLRIVLAAISPQPVGEVPYTDRPQVVRIKITPLLKEDCDPCCYAVDGGPFSPPEWLEISGSRIGWRWPKSQCEVITATPPAPPAGDTLDCTSTPQAVDTNGSTKEIIPWEVLDAAARSIGSLYGKHYYTATMETLRRSFEPFIQSAITAATDELQAKCERLEGEAKRLHRIITCPREDLEEVSLEIVALGNVTPEACRAIDVWNHRKDKQTSIERERELIKERVAAERRAEQAERRLSVKPGGCKILSLGDACDCTLCEMGRVYAKALRAEIDAKEHAEREARRISAIVEHSDPAKWAEHLGQKARAEAAESQLTAANAEASQNRIDKSRFAELERGWKKIADYIACLPEEDVPQLVFYRLEEKDAEIARLTQLALAVGNHSCDEVPPDVYSAWKQPAKYREDEMHKLREEVASKDHEAGCLQREIAALTAKVAELEAK